MRLFPSEPEIRLYEQGFGKEDTLGRADVGKKLSKLVDEIEDPIVIALDGEWGTGKSFFLKRWVGAHTIENEGKAQTIYFDAFQNDYLEDPLIAITAAIGSRLDSGSSNSGWTKLKTAAFKLAKPATKVGLAMMTFGATEVASAAIDVAIETGSKELEKAADEFWQKENGRRVAMGQLRSALTTLTGAGTPEERPLVIVVDELDRCRPDYALGILEVIKHFFTVPRVHFVLGVNLSALQNSVKARYGAGVAAEEYLRRFVTISLALPDRLNDRENQQVALAHFGHASAEMGIPHSVSEVFTKHLHQRSRHALISLRDANRILSHMAMLVTTTDFEKLIWGWKEIGASMLSIKILAPDLYQKIRTNRATYEEIMDFYGAPPSKDRADKDYDHSIAILRGIWQLVINQTVDNEQDQFVRGFSQFGDLGQLRGGYVQRTLAEQYLDWPSLEVPTNPT